MKLTTPNGASYEASEASSKEANTTCRPAIVSYGNPLSEYASIYFSDMHYNLEQQVKIKIAIEYMCSRGCLDFTEIGTVADSIALTRSPENAFQRKRSDTTPMESAFNLTNEGGGFWENFVDLAIVCFGVFALLWRWKRAKRRFG